MMRVVGRILAWLVGIAAGLVLLVAGGIAGLFLYLDTNQPDLSGEQRIDGLSAPVRIVRDAHGIPHIFAATDLDAARALGYVQAADRLAQMELQRRIGAGRVSELVGSVALPIDRTMRSLGLYREAEAAYGEASPEIRAMVDAYTAGVNAWLEGRTTPLPVEFQLLWHEPEPWRAADVMVYGKLIGLLGGAWQGDLRRAALLERLGEDGFRDLHPDDPPGSPVTLAAAVSGGTDWQRLADLFARLLPQNAASNWWALAPGRSAESASLLVNDPHLGISSPALFHLARVVTPERTLAGAFAPGTPFLILGHNGHVAWGMTTPYSDTEDLFLTPVDPADPARYLTAEGARPFTTREEVITVRFGEPVTHTIRTTQHGVVISDVSDAARQAAGDGRVIALASAALTARDPNVQALWDLNRAKSLDEAVAALRHFHAPHQNIVLADRSRIGFVSAGRIPLRDGFDGRFPVDTATGTARWTAFVPFERLPQQMDPPPGVLINANNRMVPAGFDPPIGHSFEEPWRAARIAELLAARRVHTAAGQEAILADTLSPAALDLLPLLLSLKAETSEQADMLDLLRDWNGRMDAALQQPIIFDWWLMELHRVLIADELGDLYRPELDARLVGHLLRERPGWCDDRTT
ncbi:MAG: putative penicillin acylase, partial [Pseudomonadota bacterium]